MYYAKWIEWKSMLMSSTDMWTHINTCFKLSYLESLVQNITNVFSHL